MTDSTPCMPASTPTHNWTELHRARAAAIQRRFKADGDPKRALAARSALIDEIILGLYQEHLSPDLAGPPGLAVLAVGGYGRRRLFPYSDVDLLFLCERPIPASQQEGLAALSRTLWDLKLRVGHSTHTLAECEVLHRDNLEFSISLLDSRYLAGDAALFGRLRLEVVPRLAAHDGSDWAHELVEMTERRHHKYGNTVFHLEPNIKEVPGGLRDWQVAHWLSLLRALASATLGAGWPEPETAWPAGVRSASNAAFRFLAATRCFLHYGRGRDDNLLTYEVEEEAAARGIGLPVSPATGAPPALAAEDWMRSYYRHTRAIDRLARRALQEAEQGRSSLFALFQDWRSRVSNADFSVVRGRIYPREPQTPGDGAKALALFEMIARHGLELSREAERWVARSVTAPDGTGGGEGKSVPDVPNLWKSFAGLLASPYAAEALRGMHRLGLLSMLFPEFAAIDALVTRDFYHRYTVDEHSFRAIETLHELRLPARAGSSSEPTGWEPQFAELLGELEQPAVLFFALLYHDVGKGISAEDHVRASVGAASRALERLQVEPAEGDAVCFLIANHLEMSTAVQRRDIFDPEVVGAFAAKAGTTERLKMLALLTYADVRAVNPEALTPWKAERLWQLYVSASNHLLRTVDDERVHAAEGSASAAEQIGRALADRAVEPDAAAGIAAFLEGFPRRYLASRSPEEVAAHFALASRVTNDHPVQLSLRGRASYHEMTVVTLDRPFLFASLTGVLAAWGMNIVKAEAFGNARGLVLDTFRFVDLHRTLELNPPEVERFARSVRAVVLKEEDIEHLMSGRAQPGAGRRPKLNIPTRIAFDGATSSHSTLLELVTWDRPGLLYHVARAFAGLGCNIEVALIDTEGEKVIDVFYLTEDGAKLSAALTEQVRERLTAAIGA